MSAPVAESSEARQKFANAKAISSDMFFGRESTADVRDLVFIRLRLHLLIMAAHRSFRSFRHEMDPLKSRRLHYDNPVIPTSKACDIVVLLSMIPRRDWRACPETAPSAQLTCLERTRTAQQVTHCFKSFNIKWW